eukprot:gene3562-4438_t
MSEENPPTIQLGGSNQEAQIIRNDDIDGEYINLHTEAELVNSGNINDLTPSLDLLQRFVNLETLSFIFEENTLNNLHTSIPPSTIPQSVRKLELTISEIDDITCVNFINYNIIEIGSIPDSVEELVIEHRFMDDPMKLIPRSVSKLKICNWVPTNDILDLIPDWIKELSFENSAVFTEAFIETSDYPISIDFSEGCFPSSITDLDINFNSFDIASLYIPRSVKRLFINALSLPQNLIDFPELKELRVKFNELSENSNLNGIFLAPFQAMNPPPYISEQNMNTQVFPSTLTYLKCQLRKIKVGLLPPTLKTLKLSSQIEKIEIGALPESLEVLSFKNTSFVSLTNGILPSSLKKLTLKDGVSGYQVPVFPNNLQTLKIGGKKYHEKMDVEIQFSSLPDSLESYPKMKKLKYPLK